MEHNWEKRWRLPQLRTGRTATAELAERRVAMRGLNALQVFDPSSQIREIGCANVACIEATPPHAHRATLLYLHGGGYRMGEARTWSGLASRIAAKTGCRVLVPDYRLAPEYPFPAALEDAVTVYVSVIEETGLPPIVFGDSAGGGLACSVILAALDIGAPIPAGVLLVSPWLDLTHEGESFQRCVASDPSFSLDAAIEAADLYLQGQEPTHPLLSPLRADLSAFPPCFVAASASEVVVDQSILLASRLVRARRMVELRIEEDLPHAWPVLQPASPGTEALIEAMAIFVRQRLLAERQIMLQTV